MADRLPTVSGRILPATVARLDRIAEVLGHQRPGEVVKRSDALRVAIERGVEAMERELGIATEDKATTPKEKKPARKPATK